MLRDGCSEHSNMEWDARRRVSWHGAGNWGDRCPKCPGMDWDAWKQCPSMEQECKEMRV